MISIDEINKLKAENAQLQRDYDALDACIELQSMKIKALKEENERLKEEIEKLKGTYGNIHPDSAYYKIKKLKIENELHNEQIIFLQRKCADADGDIEKLATCLAEIKEIAENSFWDYTDVTVLAVKDEILQKIAECEVE